MADVSTRASEVTVVVIIGVNGIVIIDVNCIFMWIKQDRMHVRQCQPLFGIV